MLPFTSFPSAPLTLLVLAAQWPTFNRWNSGSLDPCLAHGRVVRVLTWEVNYVGLTPTEYEVILESKPSTFLERALTNDE